MISLVHELSHDLPTLILDQLLAELSIRIGTELQLVIDDKYTDAYFDWFKEIENHAFREELRYTREEFQERFHDQQGFLLFVMDGMRPLAMVMGFERVENDLSYFYVDTFAVTVEKNGIGTLMAHYLIQYAAEVGHTHIRLDTEEMNERGVPLVRFYEKLGFRRVSVDEQGDWTLEMNLQEVPKIVKEHTNLQVVL